MSDLIKIEPEYVYVTIPAEYICVYHRILAMLADFGEEMLKDCKAACTQHNSDVVDCFNMFNAAVAARKLNKEKLAETLIKYIKAKINQIYKGADNSTDFVFPIDEDGQLKAFVSCGELPEFWINPDDMELYEHKLGNGFDEHFELSEEDFSPEGDNTEDNSGLVVKFKGTIEKDNFTEVYHPCVEVRVLYNGIETYDYTPQYYFANKANIVYDSEGNIISGTELFVSVDRLHNIEITKSGTYYFGILVEYKGNYIVAEDYVYFDYPSSIKNDDKIINSDTEEQKEDEANRRNDINPPSPDENPDIKFISIENSISRYDITIKVHSKVRLYWGGLYWGEYLDSLNGVRLSSQPMLDYTEESWNNRPYIPDTEYKEYVYKCAFPTSYQLSNTILKKLYGRPYVRTTKGGNYENNRVYGGQIYECTIDSNNNKRIIEYANEN